MMKLDKSVSKKAVMGIKPSANNIQLTSVLNAKQVKTRITNEKTQALRGYYALTFFTSESINCARLTTDNIPNSYQISDPTASFLMPKHSICAALKQFGYYLNN